MKICLLTYRGNMYCGGQGIYVYYLSREFQRLGHEVHVISGPPYPQLPEGVKLYKVKSHSAYVSRYHMDNGFGPIRNPVDLYEAAATRMGMYSEPLAFSLRAYDELRKLSSEIKFDVVHDNQCLGYGLTMIKRLKLPLVATIHHPMALDRESDFAQARNQMEKLRRWWFYSIYVPMQSFVGRRADRVITVSECSAREIERLMGIPSSRIRVVYNGVDTDVFRSLNGLPKKSNSLIFVGNTEDRKKGIIYLLQAMKMLENECQVKLTIIDGGAPEAQYAPALMERINLDGRVTFARRLSGGDLVRWYAAADIAVVPSMFEGFGLPAAEAMACEVPVIAFAAGALPELVADGETGILVPPADVPALAAAIKRLVENEELRLKMAKEARKRVQRKFNWEQAAKQVLDVYHEVA
jgi:glycosyltransferase involved in cell wall biosynthesis